MHQNEQENVKKHIFETQCTQMHTETTDRALQVSDA